MAPGIRLPVIGTACVLFPRRSCMSQKYRQPGYQDGSGERSEKRRSTSRPSREGPRSPRVTGFHEVMRCSLCGFQLPKSLEAIEFSSQCPKCKADLHSCRNCGYFNPQSRFECTQPLKERVARKDGGNRCEFFEAKTTVEKMTTSASDSRPEDARDAFERLFKK